MIEDEFNKLGLRLKTSFAKTSIKGYDSYYAGTDAANSVNLSRPISGKSSKVAGYLT